jgi:hypothetical protein
LLDFVGADLQRFQAQLGTEDRLAVEGHLQAIRSIERQLSSPMSPANCEQTFTGDLANPIDIEENSNVPMLLDLHMQLMVAALKCDVTRVTTLQFGDATGGRVVFDFVPGVPREGNGYQPLRNWHDLGHRPVRDSGEDDKSTVDKWNMDRCASLIQMLKDSPEGAGTMLDSTVLLWANHMEDGENHGAIKLPWLLAGNTNGYFKTGQCISDSGRAHTGVMAEICLAMGVDLTFFGDEETGQPMPELRA